MAMLPKFRGTIVFPDDPNYNTDRMLFNPVFDPYPMMIIYCVVNSDVQLALMLAKVTPRPFTVRSGGHCTAGFSAGSGILIDVSSLNDVYVNPNALFATVSCGCNFGKFRAALQPYGLHVPGGECDDVCIGGYMQGGGYGFTSVTLGMNSDNVISMRVLLANGQIVNASATENYDLWWAMRGGTGGRQRPAGFVTHRHAAALQHRAHPAREQAVLRHQRHRCPPGVQVRDDTGRRPLRFVFGIQRAVQPVRAWFCALWQADCHGPIGPQGAQGGMQGFGLEALHNHQKTGLRAEKDIGAVTRAGDPCDCDPPQPGFHFEHRIPGGFIQLGGPLNSPLRPGRGRHGRSHAGQAPGRLHQSGAQVGVLACLAGAGHQRSCSEQVVRRIHAQVIAGRRLCPQARGPVHRRFEPWHEGRSAIAMACGPDPCTAGDRNQLRKGNQHGGLRNMHRAHADFPHHGIHDNLPGTDRRMVCGYVIHSTCERQRGLVSVTISALYLH